MKNLLIYLLGVATGILISIFAGGKLLGDKSGNPFRPSESEEITQIDVVDSVDTNIDVNEGKITLFDQPGESVSRNNFKVKEILNSGNVIAEEIVGGPDGFEITSDLDVLILAGKNDHFYNNQIIRVPRGKSAIHIGNFKRVKYGNTIPIISFR